MVFVTVIAAKGSTSRQSILRTWNFIDALSPPEAYQAALCKSISGVYLILCLPLLLFLLLQGDKSPPDMYDRHDQAIQLSIQIS